MGPISTALLAGCLSALKWLLWVTGVLLVVMIAAQYLRNDLPASWYGQGAAAGLFVIGGWVCGWLARRLVPDA